MWYSETHYLVKDVNLNYSLTGSIGVCARDILCRIHVIPTSCSRGEVMLLQIVTGLLNRSAFLSESTEKKITKIIKREDSLKLRLF